MHILITNDDGISASGIYTLALRIAKHHDVTVIAPDRERSGVGHAFTILQPLRAKEIKFGDTQLKAFAINGTPVDCVKLGIKILMPEVDLIISGINNGYNIGTDVLYSGTVSAAIEGILHGIASIAISSYSCTSENLDSAADFALSAVNYAEKNGLPQNTILNINVPDLSKGSVKGVKITRLSLQDYDSQFVERIDPRGGRYFWLAGDKRRVNAEDDTDERWISEGYVTITPVQYDLSNHSVISDLNSEDFWCK